MVFRPLSGGELSEEQIKENAEHGELMIFIGEGNSIEGVYKGADSCAGFKGKGKQKSHKFEQSDGSILKKRGFGPMDHILKEQVNVGDNIRVTYTGKGTDGFHKCTVGLDDGSGESDETV